MPAGLVSSGLALLAGLALLVRARPLRGLVRKAAVRRPFVF